MAYERKNEIVYQYWQNPLPVLAKSSTGIGEIYWEKANLVYDFINNGVRFRQYWSMISPIPVDNLVNTGRFQNDGNKDMHSLHVCFVKFVNTGRRFGQYQSTIWPILVYDFANTEDFGRFEVEIEDYLTLKHFTQLPISRVYILSSGARKTCGPLPSVSW